MFPNAPGPGEPFSLTKPRNPRNTSRGIKKVLRRLGFPGLRLHDLHGTHETLLDSGVPLHVVAARGGHDPATPLRNYAKRTKKGRRLVERGAAKMRVSIAGWPSVGPKRLKLPDCSRSG
jgi:integrase